MPGLLAMLAGVGAGWALGGRLENVGRQNIRGLAVLLALFLAQGALRGRLPFLGESRFALYGWVAVAVGLLLVLIANWRLPGFPFLIAGIAANLGVVLWNGGMPVAVSQAAVSGSHFYIPESQARGLIMLGDHISLSVLAGSWLLSAGDILCLIGILVFLTVSMRGPARDGEPDQRVRGGQP